MLCTPSPKQGLAMGEQGAQQQDGHSQAAREHSHHPNNEWWDGAGQGSGLPWEQMVICSSAGPDGPQGEQRRAPLPHYTAILPNHL